MTFSGDIKKFGDKAKTRFDNTRRAVIVQLFSSIVKSTPVRTGRLRGNWQASIGHPATNTVDARGAQEVIMDIRNAAESSGPSDVVILRNNLPYAARIEYDGWSKQAPQGMVRCNVARFHRILDEALREA